MPEPKLSPKRRTVRKRADEIYERLALIAAPTRQERHERKLALSSKIIDELRLIVNGTASRTDRAVLAHALHCQAMELLDLGQTTEAVAVSREALAESLTSRHAQTCRHCWDWLGFILNFAGETEEAARCFQMSFAYTTEPRAWQVFWTFRSLAHAWAGREETLDAAILMFDWLILLHPTNLSLYNDRSCYLRHYGRPDPKSIGDSSPSQGTSCQAFAYRIGFHLANKDRRSAASVAHDGLRIASELNSEEWISCFRSFAEETQSDKSATGGGRQPSNSE